MYSEMNETYATGNKEMREQLAQADEAYASVAEERDRLGAEVERLREALDAIADLPNGVMHKGREMARRALEGSE